MWVCVSGDSRFSRGLQLSNGYRDNEICFGPFFLVLSHRIVILSTDVRLGVKKWGFYFLLKKLYSPFKEYEELCIPEFCAGYAEILIVKSEEVRHYRRKHLMDLMYLTTQYHWRNVLNFHATCLREISPGPAKFLAGKKTYSRDPIRGVPTGECGGCDIPTGLIFS